MSKTMKKLEIPDLKNDIFYGEDFFADISDLFQSLELGGASIVLLTGEKSFATSVDGSRLQAVLSRADTKVAHRQTVSRNPRKVDIDATLEAIAGLDALYIIAVGGGSVLDFAKACKLYSNKQYTIISVYTTLGSGSIVTPFTVFDNHEFKIGEHSEDIVPATVYVNTDILSRVPDAQLGSGVCDIYGHAVESSLSTAATVKSRQYAQASLDNLTQFLHAGDVLHLLRADVFAGLSESVGLVLVPHALGHQLTYKCGVSHGIATIVFMRAYLDFLSVDGVDIPKMYLDILENILERFAQYINVDGPQDQLEHRDVELVHTYMGFALENSPALIVDQDLFDIYSQAISDKSRK